MDDVFLRFCREYMRVQPDIPIRFSQFNVLNIICSLPGPHTPVALAAVLSVSKPMVSAHLNALVGVGYVARIASPEDRRSMYLIPTKKGRALVDKVRHDSDKIRLQMIQKMGQKKFDMLVKLLGGANDVLKDV